MKPLMVTKDNNTKQQAATDLRLDAATTQANGKNLIDFLGNWIQSCKYICE